MEVRRLITIDEEVLVEAKRPVNPPLRKIAATAVITNPFAGRYVEDLKEMIEIGEQIGTILAERILKVVDASQIESFGKACIVGEAGEIEHAGALIHPTYGKAIRQVIGGGGGHHSLDKEDRRPRHPYTEALLSSVPMPDPRIRKRKITLAGDVPSPIHPPAGCVFHPRCPYRGEKCATAAPPLVEIEPDHWLSCHYPIN